MQTDRYISAIKFCDCHQVDLAFIQSLNQWGLIEITTISDTPHIDIDAVNTLEKLVRMHYELEINLPGIESIVHMLARVEQMQAEINSLRNRLAGYEGKGEEKE